MTSEANEGSVLELRWAALMDRHLRKADVGEELLALGDDAKTRPGLYLLALRAYGNAAIAFLNHRQLARAQVAVTRGSAVAHLQGSLSGRASFVVLQGRLEATRGEHAAAVKTLVDLAGSSLGRHLLANHRLMLFKELAQLSTPIDPGDSIDLCIALAREDWNGGAQPMPAHWTCSEVLLRLYQWLWSAPPFEGLLRRPQLDPQRLSAILEGLPATIDRGLEAAPARSVEADLLNGLRAVTDSLRDRSAEAALRGVEIMLNAVDDAADVVNVTSACLGASALLVLDEPAKAAALLDRISGLMGPSLRLEPRLEHTYLRAAVADRLGDKGTALDCYRQYAKAMAAQMGSMELQVRQLLRTLTELPGARPQDLPDVVPAYLRTAIEAIRSDPVGLNVTHIAAMAGVTERTLRSAFQVHVGKSPKAFITEARLDAARRYVESRARQGMTVADLAQQFGFSNAGRFAAAYASRHGCRPLAR